MPALYGWGPGFLWLGVPLGDLERVRGSSEHMGVIIWLKQGRGGVRELRVEWEAVHLPAGPCWEMLLMLGELFNLAVPLCSPLYKTDNPGLLGGLSN